MPTQNIFAENVNLLQYNQIPCAEFNILFFSWYACLNIGKKEISIYKSQNVLVATCIETTRWQSTSTKACRPFYMGINSWWFSVKDIKLLLLF